MYCSKHPLLKESLMKSHTCSLLYFLSIMYFPEGVHKPSKKLPLLQQETAAFVRLPPPQKTADFHVQRL